MHRMSKAFTKETDTDLDADLPDEPDPLPAGQKNYITPAGLERLRDELNALWTVERPKVVEVVSGAAGNGDSRRTAITSTARSGCARSTGGCGTCASASRSPKSSTRSGRPTMSGCSSAPP
jgi:hypothetical protein